MPKGNIAPDNGEKPSSSAKKSTAWPSPKGIASMLFIPFLIGCLVFGKDERLQSRSARGMTASEYISRLEAGEIGRVVIHAGGAELVMKDGSAREVRLPVDWHPRELLTASGAEFRFSPPETNVTQILMVALNIAMAGIFAFFIFSQILSSRSSNKEYKAKNGKAITFDDVAGQDEAKRSLNDVLDYLKDPQSYSKLGARPPSGVLLIGPPGNGKTRLARALAGEANVPFFAESGSDFEEMFVGVGARRLRNLFKKARKKAPCIIFIDEIDSIGSKRGTGGTSLEKGLNQTVNQLLTLMDGIENLEGVVVIAATNMVESLDESLVRAGRFDRKVYVGNPDIQTREAILRLHAKGKPFSEDALDGLHVIARRSPGMAGADMEAIINEAAILAARSKRGDITLSDLEAAMDTVVMGDERKGILLPQDEKRLVAIHEAGHALISVLNKDCDPLHKLTSVPRGSGLGMAVTIPDADRYLVSRNRLIASLMMIYGGRAAEEVVFGQDKVTSGAQADLREATRIARAMVFDYGMGRDSAGKILAPLMWHKDMRGHLLPSINAQEKLELAVESLAIEAYAAAVELINGNRNALEALADALISRETLGGDEVRIIVSSAGQ